jgi:hypothetical protein
MLIFYLSREYIKNQIQKRVRYGHKSLLLYIKSLENLYNLFKIFYIIYRLAIVAIKTRVVLLAQRERLSKNDFRTAS